MATKRRKFPTTSAKTNKRKGKDRTSTIPSYPAMLPPKKSTSPGDDFYMYINGNWIRHAEIPPYLSSYSVSDEIEGQIDSELLSILDSARTQVKTRANTQIRNK